MTTRRTPTLRCSRTLPSFLTSVLCRAAALTLIAWLGLGVVAAHAEPEKASESDKIEWLLQRIESAQGATFIRNGESYPPSKAASHLRRKLAFAGARVQTADDFIKGIATGSSESSTPYLVRFADGTQMTSADFLRRELKAYEANPGAAAR